MIFSSNLMFPVLVRNPQRQTANQTTTSFIFPTVPTIHTNSDGDDPIFNIICNNNYSQESENSCACVCLCVCEPTTYLGTVLVNRKEEEKKKVFATKQKPSYENTFLYFIIWNPIDHVVSMWQRGVVVKDEMAGFLWGHRVVEFIIVLQQFLVATPKLITFFPVDFDVQV